MTKMAKRITAVTVGIAVTLLGWSFLGLGAPWFLPFIWLGWGLPAFVLGYRATAIQSVVTLGLFALLPAIGSWEAYTIVGLLLVPGAIGAAIASFIRYCLEDL